MTKSTGGDSKNTLYCSFCGKSQHEVRKLIAGPTVFICDECVELCMDIIREEHKSNLVKSRDGVATPADICGVLNDYVIGQDHAKRDLTRLLLCSPGRRSRATRPRRREMGSRPRTPRRSPPMTRIAVINEILSTGDVACPRTRFARSGKLNPENLSLNPHSCRKIRLVRLWPMSNMTRSGDAGL